jgi:hypothetical protein
MRESQIGPTGSPRPERPTILRVHRPAALHHLTSWCDGLTMAAVEQDGVRTDERVRPAGWLARLAHAGVRSQIVLRTLLVADVGLLVAVGTLLALFMAHPAGLAFAGCCWGLAGLLVSAPRVAHWLARRHDE